MTVPPPPHPDLGPLAGLLGEWRGTGSGRTPAGVEFEYEERSRFEHSGKPLLAYLQTTTATEDGRPLHSEAGYWRATPAGEVELVLAHGSGFAEIEVGRWGGTGIRLASIWLRGTPTAKDVRALERDIELEGDRLRYELRMAMGGGAASFHLRADLHRVSG